MAMWIPLSVRWKSPLCLQSGNRVVICSFVLQNGKQVLYLLNNKFSVLFGLVLDII
jgi:hypothetical protein